MQLGPWSYSAVHVLIHLIIWSNATQHDSERQVFSLNLNTRWRHWAKNNNNTTTRNTCNLYWCCYCFLCPFRSNHQILRKCLFCGGNSPWQLSGLTRWWTSVLVLSLFAPRWRLHSAALPPSSCSHRSARSAASPALEGWRGRWALCLPRLGRTSPLWSWASRTGPI